MCILNKKTKKQTNKQTTNKQTNKQTHTHTHTHTYTRIQQSRCLQSCIQTYRIIYIDDYPNTARGICEIYNIFYFKKVPKLASFRVKLVNFPSEKVVFDCLLQSLHFGSNRLKGGSFKIR